MRKQEREMIEKECEKKKRLEQVDKWGRKRDVGWVGEREIRRETETQRERERERWKGILLFMIKFNLFHDSWYVNDLKEEIPNLFLPRLLCMLLQVEMCKRNVLTF